jgi:hypothetical protein
MKIAVLAIFILDYSRHPWRRGCLSQSVAALQRGGWILVPKSLLNL